MTESGNESLLARLARKNGDEDNAWASVAASQPAHEEETGGDTKLAGLLSRINQLADAKNGMPQTGSQSEAVSQPADNEPDDELATGSGFIPREPETLDAAGLTGSQVEALVLKYLAARGDGTGREIAAQIRLPFVMIEQLLRQLKLEQLVVYRTSAQMNDYVYQLTDFGRERGRSEAARSTYFGSAPVALEEYIDSVHMQSLEHQQPSRENLEAAFEDLLINPRMLSRLGPAINSGRGMFLFGAPGNGKTSIAERVTRVFGEHIWIPRAIHVDGEIIRLFDPTNHIEVPLDKDDGLLDKSKIDRRWVRIERPTIVAGGELTMDNLEVTVNNATGICEAPMQLKSNCGTLVIDDFGRQRMSTDELLNRWIVPLEKRFDYLNLPNGKKIQVPFDQLIVFSTNLEPRDLVDDAFLRRIPYKIEVIDPSENEFRELFKIMCGLLDFEYKQEPIDYLVQKHYLDVGRPFRCCQPRDLLLQIRSHCHYEKKPLDISHEAFDFAAENYFAVM